MSNEVVRDTHDEHVAGEEQLHATHGREEGEDHGRNLVEITVDGKTVDIHRGEQAVATVKEKGGVPAGYVLVQSVDGRYVPLADDGRVHIKGGEVFESHVREGGSS